MDAIWKSLERVFGYQHGKVKMLTLNEGARKSFSKTANLL